MKDNSLWHFGDSFGCWNGNTNDIRSAKKGYSEYIADYYTLHLKHCAVGGYSNQQILNSILVNYNNIKKNDLVLINWSFFNRFTYLNKFNNPKSFNNILHNFNLNNYKIDEILENAKIDNLKYLEYLLFNKSEFVTEETIIEWKLIINPILTNLIDIGCIVVNSFNNAFFISPQIFPNKNPSFYSQANIKNDLLTPPNTKIQWEIGGEYIHFLHENNFYGDGEDVHYKFGVQEELSKEWIKRIDSQILTKL